MGAAPPWNPMAGGTAPSAGQVQEGATGSQPLQSLLPILGAAGRQPLESQPETQLVADIQPLTPDNQLLPSTETQLAAGIQPLRPEQQTGVTTDGLERDFVSALGIVQRYIQAQQSKMDASAGPLALKPSCSSPRCRATKCSTLPRPEEPAERERQDRRARAPPRGAGLEILSSGQGSESQSPKRDPTRRR